MGIWINYNKVYSGISHYHGAQNDVTTTNNAYFRTQITSGGTNYTNAKLNETGGTNIVDTTNDLGLLLVEAVNSTTNKVYWNNVLLTTLTIAQSDLVNLKLFFLGINYDGSYYTSPNEDQVYAFGFSKALSSGQKTNLFNSLTTLRRSNILGINTKVVDTNRCLIIAEIGESTGTRIFNNLDAEVNIVQPNVYNWHAGAFENFQPGVADNFSHDGSGAFNIGATMNYKLSTKYGKMVRYFNSCVGGTTIYSGDNYWYKGKSLYNQLIAQLLLAIAAAPEAAKDVCLVIRLGINDGFDATKAAAFQTEMIDTIAQARSDLSLPNMKCFLNRLSANLDCAYKTDVNNAIDYIVANISNVYGYNTDTKVYRTDLHHNIDSSAMDYGYTDADFIAAQF